MLEDLHWGDGLTVKLLDDALRELADRPLLILALCRPTINELFPSLWEKRVQRLPLRPLGKRASERLVQQMLGAKATPATVNRIIEQAGGNALFLEESARPFKKRSDYASFQS